MNTALTTATTAETTAIAAETAATTAKTTKENAKILATTGPDDVLAAKTILKGTATSNLATAVSNESGDFTTNYLAKKLTLDKSDLLKSFIVAGCTFTGPVTCVGVANSTIDTMLNDETGV